MTRNSFFLLVIFFFFAASCADKYAVHSTQYRFHNQNGLPDYSDLNYWAAHPWKQDPSDSVPLPLNGEPEDSIVDVFFLHPTSFTQKNKTALQNADIDDSYLNAKTDFSSVLYQATVFNQHARVFAPRYRQAHISTFYSMDQQTADSVFDIAYADLKISFEYYLQHWNHDRPIIIAAHSQGSKLALRLLKDFFEDKPLREQLVVAYILGWPVPRNYFNSLTVCNDSLQTGCICSWRTFRTNYMPGYIAKEDGSSLVTNPLSWKIDSSYASRQLNKGSVLFNFDRIYRHTAGARIHDGILWITKPRFPWGFLYRTRNYHIGDINLFYVNIRENVAQRINAFYRSKDH
jgi:hypothetical protein